MHTDRGVHYHHFSWRKLIGHAVAVPSMSRKGNCYDNAVMENFFGHLKAETYHGEHFASLDQFSQAIDRYITWYNNGRVQERITGLAPSNTGDRPLQPSSRRIKPVQLSGASSKLRGYLANFRPFFDHIPLQFWPPPRIYPHSFPARGHTFVVKPDFYYLSGSSTPKHICVNPQRLLPLGVT